MCMAKMHHMDTDGVRDYLKNNPDVTETQARSIFGDKLIDSLLKPGDDAKKKATLKQPTKPTKETQKAINQLLLFLWVSYGVLLLSVLCLWGFAGLFVLSLSSICGLLVYWLIQFDKPS